MLMIMMMMILTVTRSDGGHTNFSGEYRTLVCFDLFGIMLYDIKCLCLTQPYVTYDMFDPTCCNEDIVASLTL